MGTNLSGILNICKPAGMTSHDVVGIVRKTLGLKRVGHAGTLDPDAVGVLPICVGNSTRLAEYISGDKKKYRALICFGYETTTQDSSGKILKRTDLPKMNHESFRDFINLNFLGKQHQMPPMYSAVKINGKPLYKLAREGTVIERKEREIEIYSLEVKYYFGKTAMVDIECSKGTYIRTLCNDIGTKLNSSAYMSYLIRTRVGSFELDAAVSMKKFRTEKEKHLIKPADALNNIRSLLINQEELIKKVLHGNSINEKEISNIVEEGICKVIDKDNNLLAIGYAQNGILKIVKVLGGQDENI